MDNGNPKHKYGKYNGNELEYVKQALDSENPEFRSINWVARFEGEFKEKIGAKYAIAVNSGTSGLHAALHAVGVKPGDEVIQPAVTVVMDAFATLYLGAIPIFVDVDPKTWNIDPKQIEAHITEKTKAIIVVSLFGLPVDIDPIMKIAAKHNIAVIDDSAETVLGEYNGKMAGTMADVGVFSFENKKHMTTGSEGGMIITNNPDLAERARKFSGIGFKNLTADAGRTSLASAVFQNPNYERHDSIGLNYRMNSISAALGCAQLENIEEKVLKRQKIGKLFKDTIQNCKWLTAQETNEHSTHTYYTFGVLYYGEEYLGLKWQTFYEKYKSMGGDGFYACWKNPYLEPALRFDDKKRENYTPGLCPVSEELQKKLMLFKCNYRNFNDAIRQADILKKLIEKLEEKN